MKDTIYNNDSTDSHENHDEVIESDYSISTNKAESMVESSVIEEELIEQSISDPISKSSLTSINSSEDASCDSNIETETMECNDNNIQSEGASEIHCNSTVYEEQSESGP